MSTCASLSRTVEEPLAGTAATASTWLLIEQPGPWGAAALTDSRLDAGLGRELQAAAEGTGVRVALIRRPGRPSDGGARHRRVFIAHTLPGRAWVRTTALTDPSELLSLDLGRLGAGHHDGLGQPYRGEPLALVCANGRRDPCCALLGRPLAAELAATGGCEVFEITHVGGHRFAPTLLVLPHGYAYGRMTSVGVKGVIDALHDGRVATEGCRGRSAWDRPGQAAELAVRDMTGEAAADALTAATAPFVPGAAGTTRAAWTVTVSHTDGRAWWVAVAEDRSGAPTAASCGETPVSQPRMRVTGIAPLA